jgi:hypothetical protein
MSATTFIVRKDNLHDGKFVTRDVTCPKGGALLNVDAFALTANNVTYGAFGDFLKYWNFFPAGEDGYGVIPVWGFGTVIESEAEGIATGDRFYGYYPFGNLLAVEPVRVGANGFTDGAAHRQAMAPVYSQYVRTATDPLYTAGSEAEQLLLRPLFSTAFLIDDFLADNGFFGAKAVILSSASSKTAFGTAYFLKQRGGVEVIGLTSNANAAFVRGLGCYDRVVTYDEVTSLPAALPVAYVDMAGNVQLRAALHHHFGDNLKYDLGVGATNWDADRTGQSEKLPGAQTTMFFAPTQAQKRIAEWGSEGFNGKLAAAWHSFLRTVTDPKAPWLKAVRGSGRADAAALYHDMLAGKVRPSDGIVLSI